MADFTQIIQEINDDINTNGVGAITGAKLNEVLRDMIAAVNAEKQDPLTIDAIPTEDSTNPVQSGGVYEAFEHKPTIYHITNIQAIPPTIISILRAGDILRSGGEHDSIAVVCKIDNNDIYFVSTDGDMVETFLYRNGVFYDYFAYQLSDLANKVSGATAGHLAGLDEYGNPTDSGIAASDVATTSDLAGKQDVISDLAAIRSGAAAGATAYQKPSGGIPKTDLASGVQTSLGKADTAFQKPSGGIPASDLSTAVQTSLGKVDTAVQQVTVGTTTTGNAGTNASVTNSGTATNPVLDFTIPRGADGANGQDGADAVNPFKGWFASANALPANPAVGDYAYVKGANASDPAVIYECNTDGTWSNSGRTADTSNVQTFASGEEVNDVHIVNDLITGGVDNVLSAEQGMLLGQNVFNIELEKGNIAINDNGANDGYWTISNGSLKLNASGTYKNKVLKNVATDKVTWVVPQSYNAVSEIIVIRADGTFAWHRINEGGPGVTDSGILAIPDTFGEKVDLYLNFFGGNSISEFFIHPIKDVIDTKLRGNTKFSNSGYLNSSGAFVSNQYWRTTDFIPVCVGESITIQSNSYSSYLAWFYNKDKDAISSMQSQNNKIEENTIVVPQGASYIRCSATAISRGFIIFKTPLYDELCNVNNDEQTIKTFDSINKPIVFSGKTLVAFGDSITYGISSPDLQNIGDNKYISLFCSHVGATLINESVSGATLVDTIRQRISSYTGEADIIIVAGGVNDWQTQVTIGEFDDVTNTTLYGALNEICATIKTNYPNAIVIFITPIPTTSTTTFGVAHPDNLVLYRKAIQEVAAKNGFNVVDGSALGLPNTKSDFGNIMFAPTDCVHPTIAGHAMYARSLAGKLL